MSARLILVFAMLLSAPSAALACRQVISIDGGKALQRVKRAERLVAIGKYRKAARLVDSQRYAFEAGLNRRLLLLRSSIAFRAPRYAHDSHDQFIARLESSLEEDRAEDREDPVLLASLAEGYALAKHTEDKARKILEDLAKRDLLPDGYAYASLGTLRSKAGDTDAARAALDSCRRMTKYKRICRLSTGRGMSKPKLRRARWVRKAKCGAPAESFEGMSTF